MKHMTAIAIVLSLGAMALTGCSKGTSDDSPDTSSAPPTDTIPASLFVGDAPTNAVPLIEAKASAKAGDEIVITARVGGRKESFVTNRAMFYVTDASIPSCADMGDDHCPTPWDYCCENSDNLNMHMATVQIVNDEGQPLETSVENYKGLEPLKTVTVRGTVSKTGEHGLFVINAHTIHVKEG